jgi:Nif11 domain
MSSRNVIDFLRTHAARADLLESLKTKSKEEVIAVAADLGLPFTESEFDPLIWNLEMHLAAKRGEAFDAHFPLWATMWGKYYLDYLVTDLMPSLEEADVRSVLARL